jgi:ribosomal protein L11 methyltransferase
LGTIQRRSRERVITLDPGLSFGTGKHATHAGVPPLSGPAAAEMSGLVSGHGVRLGHTWRSARGCGLRRRARLRQGSRLNARVVEENAALNGVSIPFALDDLAHAHPPADIVVANILAPVLIQFAPQVAASLAAGPRARLVVSGILDEQYAAVRAAYEVQGLRQLDTLLIENWRSGLFTV